ncbi:MAG: divalent-cation tolerance protein CutA [Magnetococcales bacterium]|nr:divalent-cation tolerance protein CutA [Magnetococcales bacterium]
MDDPSLTIVWSTAPDDAVAEQLARSLVEEELAACVHVLAAGRSFYRWQGGLQRDAEAVLMIKTRTAVRERLVERLTELHPYEVPEILFTPVAGGAPAYLDWVRQMVPLG